MNKAERLFQLMSALQGRRSAITAKQLADRMNVSIRTIYRDIQALELSGIALEGEPGVGYMLKPGKHLPPLMFKHDELQSLLIGLRMVRAFTDKELAQAARQAEDKILSVLPENLKHIAEEQAYRIPILNKDNDKRDIHLQLRKACEDKHKLNLDYADNNGNESRRCIWPLTMIGWGDNWTLLAWCELREDYRNFRFDRITKITSSAVKFKTSRTRSMSHYFKTQLKEDLE